MSILYEKKGEVVLITLNRPEAMNAIDPETAEELSRAFMDFREDREALVAILTGAGDRAFSAGADVKKMVALWHGWSVADARENFLRGDYFSSLSSLSKPTIAAVNGFALGGGLEMAMACDLRVAAESATFGLTEVRLGLMPGRGGTQRLSRLIGLGRAMELILTGERIDAKEALRIGLVSRVVPGEKLLSAAEELARTIASRGPVAVRFAKEAIQRGYDMTLDQGLALENLLAILVRQTEDSKEGAAAFREKREPKWKGR